MLELTHPISLESFGQLEFREESSWQHFWLYAKGLAETHWEEVEEGVPSNRRCDPNHELMNRLQKLGNLRIYAAWRQRLLMAYCTWTIQDDLESKGTLIAEQGAWYSAEPGVGFKLFRWSLEQLKLLGVDVAYPHHRLAGRGDSRVGDWFRRLGAVEVMHKYSLDLKGQ